MAEAIKDTGDVQAQNQVGIDVTPSAEIKESPKGKEAQKETKTSLEHLKKEIETGKMSLELMTTYLEALSEIKDPTLKPIILGLIFSGLNKKGIRFDSLQGGKIILKEGKDARLGFGKTDISYQSRSIDDVASGNRPSQEPQYAGQTLTKEYQNIMNSFLNKGNFSLQDIATTYIYRTTDIKEASEKKLTTSQYVLYLMEKYSIPVETDKENRDPFAKFSFANESQYIQMCELIEKNVNHQSDKDFLLLFMSDKHQKSGIIDNNSVKNYAKFDAKSTKALSESIAQLTDEERAVLNLGAFNNEKDILNKWKNTPKASLGEIDTGMIGVFAFLGLFASLKWGWKGFFSMLGIGALLGAGGDKIVGKYLKQTVDSFGNNKEHKADLSGNVPTPPENPEPPKTEIYKKYETIVSNNITDKKEAQKIWGELSENKNFLAAPTSLLSIFETLKDDTALKAELQKYGIELSDENKDNYKNIFSALLKDRKEKIGDAKPDEHIGDYLSRSSKSETDGGTPATTPSPTPEKPADQAVAELETMKREGMSDLYILARGVELGYTFTKEPPKWIPPEKWELFGSKILGGAWYVVKTPLSGQAVKYLASGTSYFISGGLHKSLENGNLGKVSNGITGGINWLGNGALGLINTELSKEKAEARKYLQSLEKTAGVNVGETQKIKARLEALEKLEVAFKSGDQAIIKTALDEYKTTFDSDFKPKYNSKSKEMSAEAEIKKIKDIDAEVEKHQTELKQKLSKLDEKAKNAKNPDTVKAIQQEAQDVAKKANAEMESINKKATLSLSNLDEEAMKKVVSESKFAANLVRVNGWMNSGGRFTNKWVDKKMSGLGGKAFIGVGLVSLIYNGRGGLSEMWKNGISEENANDLKDLGIGMIPVIGGIHDLKIAIEGKDLNNRELSTGERAMRTGFGIIGLIPGAGLVTKGLFKGSKAVVAGSEVAIQTAHLSGKALTYGALGYSMVTAGYDIVMN